MKMVGHFVIAAMGLFPLGINATGAGTELAQAPAQPGAAARQDRREERQDRREERRETRQDAADRNAANDKLFAHCLIIDNRNEVELARFAQSRAQSADVKEFAAQLEKDHKAFIEKLASVAGGAEPAFEKRPAAKDAAGVKIDAGKDEARAKIEAGKDAGAKIEAGSVRIDANAPRLGAGSAGQPDLAAMKQEMADETLAFVKRELQDKDKSEFDQCYVGQQLHSHMQMIVMLKVLKNHVSGKLASVLDEGLETTQGHFDHAKKLMEQLDRDSHKTAKAESGSSKL